MRMLFRQTYVDEYFLPNEVRSAMFVVAISFVLPAIYLVCFLDRLFFSFGSFIGWLSTFAAFGPALFFSRKLEYAFSHFISQSGAVWIGVLVLVFLGCLILESNFAQLDIAKRMVGTILTLFGAYVAIKASKEPRMVDELRREAISRTWN